MVVHQLVTTLSAFVAEYSAMMIMTATNARQQVNQNAVLVHAVENCVLAHMVSIALCT